MILFMIGVTAFVGISATMVHFDRPLYIDSVAYQCFLDAEQEYPYIEEELIREVCDE